MLLNIKLMKVFDNRDIGKRLEAGEEQLTIAENEPNWFDATQRVS